MTGTSDKARFYIERAVPQLQEFEQKRIFTKDEIRDLVKKRSEHEHRVLAPRATPTDFARYATWEINLEALRQKRCRRLRIKSSSVHAGQARIFQIFDRATKKHPGEIALWVSHLEYLRQAKATNKTRTVLTQALRLHPTKPELWLYATRWSLEEQRDLAEARSYMQRGTRFCNRTCDLWVEYARLEMLWLSKIAVRRKMLGLDLQQQNGDRTATDELGNLDAAADMLVLGEAHAISVDTRALAHIDVDAEATKDPTNAPALQGAIPTAIFDASRKQPFFTAEVAATYFDMFATFASISSPTAILQHVLDSMRETYPKDAATWSCYLKQPLVGIDVASAACPGALRAVLARIPEALQACHDTLDLSRRVSAWIEGLLQHTELDTSIRTVLEAIPPKIANA